MEDAKTGKAGKILWALASVLLLLVWVVSMPLDDDRLCNAVPPCFGLAGVLLLGVLGMLFGARPARPTLTCLFGLTVGLYFLIRCLMGDMLSEICRELPLILAAFVFYGAGYLMAQQRGGGALSLALSLGVVRNVIYLFLLQRPDIPVEVTGRPAMSLAGANKLGCTLLTYRNFSAIFLMIAGGVLVCRPIWMGWKGWGTLVAALLGMVGMVCACLCDSRAVLALPPLMLAVAWLLWAIIRLYCEKRLGVGVVLTGIVMLVGIVVILGDLLMGDSLLKQILAVDTHGRTNLWSHIYSILPQVPWCGHGAGATTWQLVPILEEWFLPNYAHNEYLQAWVDYGIVGVCLMLAVLLVHLGSGFWGLASEEIDRQNRVSVAVCMLLLLAMASCAVFDFVWHNVALVGVTAFACGVLASSAPSRHEPWFRQRRWAPGSRPRLQPVRYVGVGGSILYGLGALALLMVSAGFAWKLLPAWRAQWQYNALYHAGAPEEDRAVFLEEVMPVYPDPELVDHYVTLSPPAGRADHFDRRKAMFNMALETNPYQLFTLTMLVETLGLEGKYEEAEQLMREHYAPGGMPGTRLANWPACYGMNLLMWGKQRMSQGDYSSALSMMEYALNLWGHAKKFHRFTPSATALSRIRNKTANVYISARRVDVDMLRAIGVDKDDSWMRPLSPGGSPALYEQWGREPHAVKYPNPYARRSPLKL